MGKLLNTLEAVLHLLDQRNEHRRRASRYEHGCDPRPYEEDDRLAGEAEAEAERLLAELLRVGASGQRDEIPAGRWRAEGLVVEIADRHASGVCLGCGEGEQAGACERPGDGGRYCTACWQEDVGDDGKTRHQRWLEGQRWARTASGW